MQTHAKKLLVIIGEAALEKFLVHDIKQFGAHGYTLADVRGGGSHGTREADWEGNRSIRMEIVCEAAVAKAISEHVLREYCQNFSVAMFMNDVNVLRPEKY
jgi:nitrogen regulatory protein P-II 2